MDLSSGFVTFDGINFPMTCIQVYYKHISILPVNLDDDCGCANPVENKPQFPCKRLSQLCKNQCQAFSRSDVTSLYFRVSNTLSVKKKSVKSD